MSKSYLIPKKLKIKKQPKRILRHKNLYALQNLKLIAKIAHPATMNPDKRLIYLEIFSLNPTEE